jgi:hypothetical protein
MDRIEFEGEPRPVYVEGVKLLDERAALPPFAVLVRLPQPLLQDGIERIQRFHDPFDGVIEPAVAVRSVV